MQIQSTTSSDNDRRRTTLADLHGPAFVTTIGDGTRLYGQAMLQQSAYTRRKAAGVKLHLSEHTFLIAYMKTNGQLEQYDGSRESPRNTGTKFSPSYKLVYRRLLPAKQ